MIEPLKIEREEPILRTRRNRTFADILDGVTITTVILIIIAVAMLYLTNISVDMNMSWKDFGYEAVILYIFTVTINLLSRSVAKRRGRETPKHIEAYEEVERLESCIIDRGLKGLEREYCRNWEEEELKESRIKVLGLARLDINDFENTYLKYSSKELKEHKDELNLTDYQIKYINKARKIKRLKYDERYLSANFKEGRRTSPTGEINTAKYERVRTIKYLITAFMGVCVSASLALDIISNPTFGTVVMCIIKIVTILISAMSGIIGGYKLTSEMETSEYQKKAAEQKNFIKWCETKIM